MAERNMTLEVMEYIVWIIEITANEFFNGDKTLAYNAIKGTALWSLYVSHYDVTHTLGSEYILAEIREYFNQNR